MGARTVIEAEDPKRALKGKFGGVQRSQAAHIADLENAIGELESAGYPDLALKADYLKRCVENPMLWRKYMGTVTEREYIDRIPARLRANGFEIQADDISHAAMWCNWVNAGHIKEAEEPKQVFKQIHRIKPEMGVEVGGGSIRRLVGKRIVNGVYIWYQKGKFPHAEGVLQIDTDRNSLVRQNWASFSHLANMLRRWRNLEGAPLFIDGAPAGKVGPRNFNLAQIAGAPLPETEGPKEFFKGQLAAPAALMRGAGLTVVEAPYNDEKGVTYSLRGTLYQTNWMWSWLVGYAERGNKSADLEIWLGNEVVESSVGEVDAIRKRLKEACYWIRWITANVVRGDTAKAIIQSNMDKLESVQEAEGPKEFFNHMHSYGRILMGQGFTNKGVRYVYRHEFPKFILDCEVHPEFIGTVLLSVAIENKADELDFAVYTFTLSDPDMTKAAQELPPLFHGWKTGAEHLEPRTASHQLKAKLSELFGKERTDGAADGALTEAEDPKSALKRAAATSAQTVRDMLAKCGFELEDQTIRYERWHRPGHNYEPNTYWEAVRYVAYGEDAGQLWDLTKYATGHKPLWSMNRLDRDTILYRLKRSFTHPETGVPYPND